MVQLNRIYTMAQFIHKVHLIIYKYFYIVQVDAEYDTYSYGWHNLMLVKQSERKRTSAAQQQQQLEPKKKKRIFSCIPREPFYSQIINYFHLCTAVAAAGYAKIKTFQLSAVAILSVALFLFLFYLFFFIFFIYFFVLFLFCCLCALCTVTSLL